MARKRRRDTDVDTAFDDGEWLHRLLAPARARLRREPTTPTVLRLRRRIWLGTAVRRLPAVA